MLVYGMCECRYVDVCVFCASSGSCQCCVMDDSKFVNAGQG